MGQFDDNVVLITGGGSGVGLATARKFFEAGAKVMITGRDREKLIAAIHSINACADNITGLPCDVTDYASVEKLVAATVQAHGPIDILVNNAGTNLKARTMRELSVDDWNRLIRTNLDGAFHCIKAVLPSMLERKNGMIINVNSVSGKRAYPLAGAGYAAGKFGLHALAGCLASEEVGSGVRVSSVYPGEIDTPILDQRPTPVSDAQKAKILKSEDVADAIYYIAGLPPHVNIPELIIMPSSQGWF
jgi:NADP-dependent 3-hydroxy acid dehydrogenase YdfG